MHRLLAVVVLSQLCAAFPGLAAAHEPADLQQYFYVDFPRRLQAINEEIALAELDVAYWRARLESYRPMRSFGAYSATYTAERSARIQLLSAQQQLACLLRDKGDLWRERLAVAQAALIDQKSQPR